MSRFTFRSSTLVVAAAAALALAAAPAIAQGSSPPGGPPKGPPSQTPPANTDRGNVPADRVGQAPGRAGRSVSGTDALSVSLAAPAAQIGGALRAGTLATPAGVAIAPQAQLTLHRLVTSSGEGAEPALVAALTTRGNADAQLRAKALAQALRGLLAAPAQQLQAATVAYNAFVDASSTAFLSAPPAEFLAVQATLLPMVERALAASK